MCRVAPRVISPADIPFNDSDKAGIMSADSLNGNKEVSYKGQRTKLSEFFSKLIPESISSFFKNIKDILSRKVKVGKASKTVGMSAGNTVDVVGRLPQGQSVQISREDCVLLDQLDREYDYLRRNIVYQMEYCTKKLIACDTDTTKERVEFYFNYQVENLLKKLDEIEGRGAELHKVMTEKYPGFAENFAICNKRDKEVVSLNREFLLDMQAASKSDRASVLNGHPNYCKKMKMLVSNPLSPGIPKDQRAELFEQNEEQFVDALESLEKKVIVSESGQDDCAVSAG